MRLISWTILIAGLAGCGDETQVSQPLEALAQSTPNAQYAITKFSASLGGVTSRGTAINNRGWVAGFSNLPGDNTRHAALWRDGSIRDLGTLGGPNCPACHRSVVWPGLNDQGPAVGISGDCDIAVGRFSARHSVLWENGTVTAIPNLGGATWNTPMDINASGDVVGFSNPVGPGDPEGDFISHAFLWARGTDKAQDLGTLGGDFFSEAFAINGRGQVVGVSSGGPSGPHAFIWEDGVMTDLNDLVGTGNLHVLLSAQDINDAGQITGRVRDHTTGQTLTFVATPVGIGRAEGAR